VNPAGGARQETGDEDGGGPRESSLHNSRSATASPSTPFGAKTLSTTIRMTALFGCNFGFTARGKF
jgi:hypothetical protein